MTMTTPTPVETAREGTCAWCSQTFVVSSTRGRVPTYCCDDHRQRAVALRSLVATKPARRR